MTRSWLAAAVVLCCATTAQAALEIKNIQAAHSVLGPERKGLDYHPGEEVVFRFVIAGARVNAEGMADVTLALKLTNSNGDLVLAQDAPLKLVLGLGGGSFPAHTRINLGERTQPDDYTMTVTIVDKLSLEKTSFQRKITCKPPEFALIAPEFFYDQDGRVAAPCGGVLGHFLHFRFKVIGMDRGRDKLDVAMEGQVLDAQGKEMMPKPITAEVKNDDAEVVRKVGTLTFRGHLMLNRVGDFTLRLIITDRQTNKTTKFEAPLRVTAP